MGGVTMKMLDHGEDEKLKAFVHVGLGMLAALCAIYNTLAYLQRRERHLGVNAVVYTSMVVLEAVQVQRHVRDM